ncbi:MAG: ATP-dependent DNA helicase RecG [Aquificaceae bacterium]|nr:ATP-dependent DNA helicase RecG [Aquificaceae bacterium]MDW8423625.1 ATP-dependent DNA helicase RecG [Aquificaceae bacterium]
MEEVQDRLQRAKSLVAELSERDYFKLRRSIGVGIYLFNLLKEFLEPSYLDLLKEFDRLPFEKRKGVLKELQKRLSEPIRILEVDFSHVEKKPITAFFKPLEDLKILDEKEKKSLKAFGIRDLYTTLWFVPMRYEDRRLRASVKTTKPGQKVAIKVRVLQTGYNPEEKYPAWVECEDGTGKVYLRFRYKDQRPLYAFKKGQELIVYGKLKEYRGEKYMVHPEVLREEESGKILPFYYIRVEGELKSISVKRRHELVRRALSKLSELAKYMPEYIPEELLKKRGLPQIAESLYLVHKPTAFSEEELNSFSTPFQKRLIYEDLFLFQLVLQLTKAQVKALPAIGLKRAEESLKEFTKSLPFNLTEAQKRAVEEILQDVKSSKPMNRLLQGDVGSGKTVVAMAVAYAFAKEGYQSAIMVPTEILAQQHYENFKRFLEPLGVRVGLLTGSVKGSLRKSLLNHIRMGNIKVILGTHALIQEGIEFNNLAFVVIDEQHRFGVLQRRLLLEKGKGYYPHCLVMSATPIPRTLALSIYGDLDLSVIDQMPSGRKPVITRLVFDSEFEKVLRHVKEELSKGHKVYVIYPLIEESEKLQLKSAVQEYERWKGLLPDKKVLLMHGRLKDEEKRQVMESFKREGDVLVSTTVVEVGVDVPDATLMIVESAHRFGLSQLHQLRGRVGRSDLQSYCYLLVPDEIKEDEDAIKRLRVLVRSNDGFEIAEEDMKLRGPGELLGESQSGYFGFWVANLGRAQDRALLEMAKEDALWLMRDGAGFEKYPDLKRLLLHRYGDKMDLSYIA